MEADLSLLMTHVRTWAESLSACSDGKAGGVAFLMALCVVSHWFKRDLGPGRVQASDPLNLIGVVLRLFVAPLLMTIAILLALARAAGRSHFRW